MIMDSGVTMGHDQFSYIKNKITKVATGIREKMEDGNGHGTHVARWGRGLGLDERAEGRDSREGG
jgi:hypothetical protein